MNYKTSVSGFIKIEALDAHNNPLKGREFSDCDYLSGNETDRLVTWKGQSDLGHRDGAAAVLRFKMRSASIYSVRFAAE